MRMKYEGDKSVDREGVNLVFSVDLCLVFMSAVRDPSSF